MLPHPTSDYALERYNFLFEVEGFRPDAYSDPEGIPTIGAGINLQVRSNLDAVLAVLGFDVNGTTLTGAGLEAERDYIQQIRDTVNVPYVPNDDSVLDIILNNILAARRADTRYDTSFARRQLFEFNDENEAKTAFNAVIGQYETQVDNWLTTKSIASTGQSQERIVLVSLAFNGKDKNKDGFSDLLGDKLATALRNNDRAEAWYEIRYNSNGGSSRSAGIANRRYKESDKFDLYENTALTETEAKSIYRMFTRHKDTILAYEDPSKGGFDPTNINANSQKIDFNLAFAHDLLNNDFSVTQGISVTWDHTQVGEDATTLYGNRTTDSDVLTGSDQSDLILGESGNDVIQGGLGSDVLYGGTGVDIYQYRPGDGNDIIKDEDGKGVLVYDPDGTAQGLSVGLRKPDDAPNEWKSPDSTVTYQVNGADLTIVTPTGTITVKNFNKDTNDLGIRLVDPPTDPPADLAEPGSTYDPVAKVLRNGTELSDRAGTPDSRDLDGDGNNDLGPIQGTAAPETIHGQAGDDDLNGGVGDRLYGDAGDDLIRIAGSTAYAAGGIGRDILIGGSGADHLVGGPEQDPGVIDDDAIQGGDGDDYLEGGYGSDVLAGGAGREVATNNNPHIQYGTRLPVFIENQNSLTGNHGKELMTDALGLASVFATIDPSLNTMDPRVALQKLFDIMESSAGTPGKSLENTLDALRTLFQQNYISRTASTNANPTATDRDSFYANLLSLQGYLKGLPTYSTTTQGLGFTVDKLTDRDTTSLAAAAKADIATRYALYKLNPFVVKGAGLYEAINADHSLDRYDPSTGSGALTDEYLKDRAAFLRNKIVANNKDHDIGADATTLATTWVQYAGQPQYFEDNGNYLPYKLYLGSDAAIVNQPIGGLSQIRFGGASSDTLAGGEKWDKLYGLDGADTLQGNKGNDYLEGGQGTDTYLYASNDGLDTILDTDGLGQITFDGTILTGGNQLFGETYKSSDGNYLYTLLQKASGQDLLISGMGGQIVVKDFQRNNELREAA